VPRRSRGSATLPTGDADTPIRSSPVARERDPTRHARGDAFSPCHAGRAGARPYPPCAGRRVFHLPSRHADAFLAKRPCKKGVPPLFPSLSVPRLPKVFSSREPHSLGAGLTSSQKMDKTELVQLVSSKTGLNEQMATLAVDTVIGFLKQKLPAELSGQLDSLLSGQESSSGILGAVKGLFGKKDS
jgi:hypothetical protein